MDEEAVLSLHSLEAGAEGPAPAAEAAETVSAAEPPPVEETGVEEAVPEEPLMPGAAEVMHEHTEDDIKAFKESLFGDNLDASAFPGDVLTVEEPDIEEPVAATDEPATPVLVGETEELGVVDVPETPEEEDEIVLVDEDEVSFGDMADVLKEDAPGDLPATDTFAAAEEAPVSVAETVDPSRERPSLETAEQFIGEGHFAAAFQTYRSLLAESPENPQVLQRMEELRALLKLMGKDKDELIGNLSAFLERIQNRRDEFFGSS
jgi:hypothetical protein